MEVILCEAIPNLGDEGQTVKVKDGYARNYLIPKGYALSATSASAAQIAHRQKMLKDQRMRQIRNDQDMARALSEIEVKIPVKVGEEDRIHGSVTSSDIAKALKAKGFDVDRRIINLEDPIRAVGVYPVNVRFSAENEAKLQVRVEQE
jgi:large subunit ribosomal protein L9